LIEVSKEYLDCAIETLYKNLGVREDISTWSLYHIFTRGNVEETLTKILRHIGLPVKINISYVPINYDPVNSPLNSFKSQSLVVGGGKNAPAITAQVRIPQNIPIYGTMTLIDFPIDVKLSDNINDYPETFFAIMAHEFTHVLLHSMQHKEKESEVHTDIAAMFLGFREVFSKGRKISKEHTEYSFSESITHRETITYGYLNDNNFAYVNKKISRLLDQDKRNKKRYLKQFRLLKKRLDALNKMLFRCKKYIQYLDDNKDKKIKPKDIEKIIRLHRLDYIEQHERFVKTISENLTSKYKPVERCLPGDIDSGIKSFKILNDEIKEQECVIADNLKTLAKYINSFQKMSNFLSGG
jgi:hypothetical protein